MGGATAPPIALPLSTTDSVSGLFGDDHALAAGVPGLDKRRDRYLFVAAALDAAVVEVHDAGDGVYSGDDQRVVGVGLIAGLVPDEFGVDARDYLVTAGQIVFEGRQAGGDAGFSDVVLVGVHTVNAIVRQQ